MSFHLLGLFAVTATRVASKGLGVDMKSVAVMKYVRMSPTKIRRVADLVRGRTVSDCVAVLRCLPHRGARLLEALIRSAKANAEEMGSRSSDELRVVVASVDSGPTLKRMQPHARGIGFEIKKRMSHITVELESLIVR